MRWRRGERPFSAAVTRFLPARDVARYLLRVLGDQSLKRRFLLDLSTRKTVSCGARTTRRTLPDSPGRRKS
jgi:hypothetical protein